MSMLLISPDGMLGHAFERLLQAEGLEYRGVRYPDFDITAPEQVQQAVAGHDVVINCSAYTDVDGAETHEDAATAVNGTGVGHLAAACHAAGAVLIHYSTDYVFDGNATAPYATDHPIDPVNAYGRSKAVGERAIADSGCQHLVLRTSWLYAPWAKNFVRTMVGLTTTKPELKVVDDQRGRPTSAEHLAQASLGLLRAGTRGFHHVTDGGECTWYEFACAIRDGVGGTADIKPCTSEEFVRPATRPPYSVLDLSTTEAAIGAMPDWRDNLAAVLRAL